MNVIEVLLVAWAAGLVLTRDGDGLHINKRKEEVPLELLEALRANKLELLAILPDQAAVSRGGPSCNS